MMTSQATDISNSNCICCGKDEERVVTMKPLIMSIPDNKAFTLECGEVIDAREKERVKVLGGVGPWDETSR